MVMPAEKARKLSENRLSWWERWRNRRHKLNAWSIGVENAMNEMAKNVEKATKNNEFDASIVLSRSNLYADKMGGYDVDKLREEEQKDIIEGVVRATENQLRSKGYKIEQTTTVRFGEKIYYIIAKW